MNAISEFQIYIGSLDSQLNTELVNEIAFSMYRAVGGYLHENGDFVSENSMCINIIGARDLDIVSLAKSLSMFMNQECSLVVKNIVKTEYC